MACFLTLNHFFKSLRTLRLRDSRQANEWRYFDLFNSIFTTYFEYFDETGKHFRGELCAIFKTSIFNYVKYLEVQIHSYNRTIEFERVYYETKGGFESDAHRQCD